MLHKSTYTQTIRCVISCGGLVTHEWDIACLKVWYAEEADAHAHTHTHTHTHKLVQVWCSLGVVRMWCGVGGVGVVDVVSWCDE